MQGKTNPRRKRVRRSTIFRRFSWWGVLVGCGLVAVAYVVVLYYYFVSPLSFRWCAIFGEPDYPQGYEVQGIDISHYQENIKWDVLRRSRVNGCPLSFVIVKAWTA